ncbi:dipeptide/oligopeptide/nickel ABC transporter permease/ATP-binding protein [Nocardioides bruguierae]|uniref:Dipeptide/oligopeptide/nickel ABC transporter permease/ATP-binding protein n=1 Tax=Nocardioides bruguierae TaxID=2945102 RepID=A0A9X2IFK8_9ACTN|nr:dipeptide/oligopeptide/nickel ABC transporter permease/ATP-binding protein [Nocardioides bruguierae]MCM0621427.1 dipeptide/oligopeptide/nickel ABC transporter permease/ATP-binding protein [Nocardioides bruguierae]
MTSPTDQRPDLPAATPVPPAPGAQAMPVPPPPEQVRRVPRGPRLAALRRPGPAIGLTWLLLVLAASLTSPLWLPYGTAEQDLARRFEGPSADHWLGTDDLGRDLLTRIVAAAGVALTASLVTVLVALVIAVPLALAAAERGPRVERWTSRVSEVLLALPATIIMLAVIGVIGVRTYWIMAVLGVLISAAVYRVLLGVAQSVRQRLYVDAARVDGLRSWMVNARHVLPGMASVVAVQAAQLFGVAILIQSGLAFIGFGPADPEPSWGGMIAVASRYVYTAPWMMVPTGVVLALTVIAANAVADGIAAHAASVSGHASSGRRSGRVTLLGATHGRADDVRLAVPAGAGTPLLEVEGLRVATTEGPELVTGVSFSVGAGRVVGLVGESGCGKSMTARSLLGLLPTGVRLTQGALRWEGTDLLAGGASADKALRRLRGREIAMISQEPMVALDPMFSVRSQLVAPLRRFRGVSRREAVGLATDLLAQVGIVDAARVLDSYPHQLSGGMAQRVAIALALTGEPRLLVADEPTTALDVTVQAEILSLLRSLVTDTGLSVVIVSHDLGVIADLCDDVNVMYAGEVVESGSCEAVLASPAHPYTAALLEANPHVPEGEALPHRLPSIGGTVPAPAAWTSGCRFAGRCRFATRACAEPLVLTAAPGVPVGAVPDHAVRCVRADDLSLTAAPEEDPR